MIGARHRLSRDSNGADVARTHQRYLDLHVLVHFVRVLASVSVSASDVWSTCGRLHGPQLLRSGVQDVQAARRYGRSRQCVHLHEPWDVNACDMTDSAQVFFVFVVVVAGRQRVDESKET